MVVMIIEAVIMVVVRILMQWNMAYCVQGTQKLALKGYYQVQQKKE